MFCLVTAFFLGTNTRLVRVYSALTFSLLKLTIFPVIPYTRAFHSDSHLSLHASITSLSSNSLTLSKPFPKHGLTDVIHFEYAVYALGSHLPSPINLWGAPPPIKSAPESLATYEGNKVESIAWLQQHQRAIEAADSVLVVGGGALGIRESRNPRQRRPSPCLHHVRIRN